MHFQDMDLFVGVSRPVLEALDDLVETIHLEAGEFLFREGDPAGHFYVLDRGRVSLRFSDGGQEMFTLGAAGQPIGWSSLVGDDHCKGEARCEAPARLYRFEKEQMSRLLLNHPKDGLAFHKRLSKTIASRLLNALLASYRGDPPPSFDP